MANSSVRGKHMDLVTFIRSVRFANDTGARVLIISGGEPTDNPEFELMLDHLAMAYTGKVVITTHGYYMMTDPDKAHHLFKKYSNFHWQITNDERYYPKKLDPTLVKGFEKLYPHLMMCWEIGGHIFPQGRAVKYMKIDAKKSKCMGPRCFNLRSISNHMSVNSLNQAVAMLESGGKFCTPAIRPNGSIGMGEGDECPSIGHVLHNQAQIFTSIIGSQCNDCKMLNSLTPLHWNAIGYRRK